MLDSKTSKATFCQHDKDGCCDVISSTTSASRGLQVRQWVDSICSSWDFKQIIPAHFDAPIPAGPADLRSCPPCLACFQTYCLLPNRAEAPGSLISNCKLFGSERDSLLAEQLCCPLFRSSEYWVAVSICRKAFTFLFADVGAVDVKPSGGFLAQFFKKAAKEAPVQTEFPFDDMRGLRAIENTLQRANVINRPDSSWPLLTAYSDFLILALLVAYLLSSQLEVNLAMQTLEWKISLH